MEDLENDDNAQEFKCDLDENEMEDENENENGKKEPINAKIIETQNNLEQSYKKTKMC